MLDKIIWTGLMLGLVGVQLIVAEAKELAAQNRAAEPAFIANPSWEKVVAGLNFPEGPAWDGHTTLYVSNCYGGWISRVRDTKTDTFLSASDAPFTFRKTNGLTVAKNGEIFACDFGIGAILAISPAGKTRTYAAGYQGLPFNRPNDLTFDRQGNLYFTDPLSYDPENPDGRIFRVDADSGAVLLAASGWSFPNGLAFSADDRLLYVCESARHRIIRFQVQPDGLLNFQDVFVELPGGDPDGMNFDQAGNLYVAHFGGGTLYIIAPDGNIRQKIATPGKKPTNVEFGGDDLRTLYLTEVETNALYRLPVPIPGQTNTSKTISE